jgi:hypothetical protein
VEKGDKNIDSYDNIRNPSLNVVNQ